MSDATELPNCFITNETNRYAQRPNRKWKIQYGSFQNGSTYMLARRPFRNAFSTAKPMFSGFKPVENLSNLIVFRAFCIIV
jgi:hypothetical protein